MAENKLYDIIIIGAGVAGMTAAIYAGRSNKSVAIVDKDGFGGNIAKSPKVENIPGFISISGADFAAQMYNQMTALSTVEHFMNEAVLIDYKRGIFIVSLDDRNTLCGKSIIFATGTKFRELNLDTKNVYYCILCDGPFFKNKNVIVVGSGNTGATYALELATYCKNVYLCDITDNMCCEATLQKQVTETENITWLPKATIANVTNNKAGNLIAVELSNSETIKCSAIFAAIGQEPQTKIVGPFAKLDDKKYIISTDCTTTNVPGVFVAGDCRTNNVKQVVTATSDGATAALEAIKFVNSLPKIK